MDYTGALTNNGLDFGTVPAGFTPNVDLFVQTSVAQQVNLVNAQGAGSLTFWDGNDSALFNNNQVNGGTGTWLAAPANNAWTNSAGAINGPWLANGFAIFQGTPGTVTVDNSAGAVSFSGAQFAVDGYTVTGQALTTTTPDTILRVGDGLPAGAAMTATVGAVIQGTGGLNKTDLGTLVLTAANTYTGGTTVSGGTLSIASDANLGAATGGLTLNGGTLRTTADLTSARAVTLGAAGGTIDNGGLPITFAGRDQWRRRADVQRRGHADADRRPTPTAAGRRSPRARCSSATAGRRAASGAVRSSTTARSSFNRSDAVTLAQVVSGSGTLTQQGPGTLTLTGANTYTGATTVTRRHAPDQRHADGGDRRGLGRAGATLGGIGTTGGVVTVADGGHLSPGAGPGTLTTGGLVLSPGALLDYELTTPGVVGGATNDLTVVNGALTLDGVLNISGAFAPGTYRLMNYTGALTDHTLAFGTVPGGALPGIDLFVQTSVASQVNLINSFGLALTVWDGGDATLHDNGAVNGGAGVWSATAESQLDAGRRRRQRALDGQRSGDLPGHRRHGDGGQHQRRGDASAARRLRAMATRSPGSHLTTTTARDADQRRDGADGDDRGRAPGQRRRRQDRRGHARAVRREHLHGGHDDQRRHAVHRERRESGRGDRRPDPEWRHAADDGESDVGTRRDAGRGRRHDRQRRLSWITFAGVISGAGALTTTGTGTLTLTGDNTYTGGTTIAAGTLQLGNGGATGSVVGDIVNNAALVFNRSDALTYGGVVSGAGTLTQAGTGTLILTGDNTYTGGTTITAGTLQIGDGGPDRQRRQARRISTTRRSRSTAVTR